MKMQHLKIHNHVRKTLFVSCFLKGTSMKTPDF